MRTTITPQMAQAILKKNTINRKETPALVYSIAEEIKIGNFVYNGESIIISENGNLMDGQHRLMACVLANKSIEVNLVQGVKEDVMPTIDTGRPRKAADVFSMQNIKDSVSTSAMIRGILERLGKQSRLSTLNRGSFGSLRYSHINLLDFYNTHKEVIVPIMEFSNIIYRRGARILPGSKIGAFIYLFSYENDSEIAIDFFRELMLGIRIRESNAAQILRNKLINDKISKKKLSPKAKTDNVIKAYRYYADNKNIKRLGFSENEKISFMQVDVNIPPLINIGKLETLIGGK